MSSLSRRAIRSPLIVGLLAVSALLTGCSSIGTSLLSGRYKSPDQTAVIASGFRLDYYPNPAVRGQNIELVSAAANLVEIDYKPVGVPGYFTAEEVDPGMTTVKWLCAVKAEFEAEVRERNSGGFNKRHRGVQTTVNLNIEAGYRYDLIPFFDCKTVNIVKSKRDPKLDHVPFHKLPSPEIVEKWMTTPEEGLTTKAAFEEKQRREAEARRVAREAAIEAQRVAEAERAERLRMKKAIGDVVCRDVSLRDRPGTVAVLGFVEGIANQRIQIRINQTMRNGRPFQLVDMGVNTIIWDDATNWDTKC